MSTKVQKCASRAVKLASMGGSSEHTFSTMVYVVQAVNDGSQTCAVPCAARALPAHDVGTMRQYGHDGGHVMHLDTLLLSQCRLHTSSEGVHTKLCCATPNFSMKGSFEK